MKKTVRVLAGGLMTAGYIAIVEKVIDYVEKKVNEKKESK